MIDSTQIIVALDGMTPKRALQIAKKLRGHVWGFKVNDLLFDDPKIIRRLKQYGRVFADAKLHDIPNTVAHSTRRLAELGADIITVHASGGKEMMRAARRAAGKSKIVAVTILTSQKNTSRQKVLALARDAIASGLDGIVCSGHEITAVKKMKGIGKRVVIVPGVRPLWYKKKNDQSRIITPERAISLGANYIVIGRPITEARDHVAADEALEKDLFC